MSACRLHLTVTSFGGYCIGVMTTTRFKSLPPTLIADNMSAELSINYNNNKEKPVGELQQMQYTLDNASATTGINIFRQSFPVGQTVSSDATITKEIIINKLNNVLKSSANDTAIEEVTQTAVVFDGLYANGLKLADTNVPTNYVLNNNYGVVFRAKQGSTDKKYWVNYIYFKDNTGNLWVAFITGVERAPLLFDIQDGRDVIFTCEVTSGAVKGIKSIDTSNFVLNAVTGGWSTANLDLKNTSFNLSMDDTDETEAQIIPFFAFKVKA